MNGGWWVGWVGERRRWFVLLGVDYKICSYVIDLCGAHCQVKSLAAAAHLLNDNGGVLR